MRILLLDNYDSFTYNLYQLILENKSMKVDVIRNDEIELEAVQKYDKIILSPGPGIPEEAGLMLSIIDTYKSRIPVFGVCLGMQAIAEVYGAKLYNLSNPLHGVSSIVKHRESKLFKTIPEEFSVGHYHSWAVDSKTLPNELRITAEDRTGIVMALEHSVDPVYGVQFHPESILTEYGMEIVNNFLSI